MQRSSGLYWDLAFSDLGRPELDEDFSGQLLA